MERTVKTVDSRRATCVCTDAFGTGNLPSRAPCEPADSGLLPLDTTPEASDVSQNAPGFLQIRMRLTELVMNVRF